MGLYREVRTRRRYHNLQRTAAGSRRTGYSVHTQLGRTVQGKHAGAGSRRPGASFGSHRRGTL